MADKQGPNTISGNISQKILELWDDNTTVSKATVPLESVVSIKESFIRLHDFCSKHFLLWEIFKEFMLQVCRKTYIGLYEMFINDVRFKP